MERIAAGGMGEVFRARDAVLARDVAVKVLHRSLAGDQAFVDRFRREARAAATLNHPNIVAVYDWGAVDGVYYMVMEHVAGRGVRDLLNALGRLEPAQAAEIVRQTLVALEHAHGHGIVHRDLKPENMLVQRGGVVKLTDLGLARAFADGRATQAGTVTGTVQYLAPEQIRGEPADPRSDLYSLGIVTYELLTGRLPFAGETAMAIAYKHLSDRVPAPSASVPGLPSELDAFVASATDRDRELRPESAGEMRRDLESIARGLPPAAPLAELVDATPLVVDDGDGSASPARATTVTIPRAERRRRRGLRRAIGALAAVAALAAAAWGAWTYAVPHTIAVPDVVGTPLEEARARLQDAGFVVRVRPGEHSLEVATGSVLSVQPAPGTELDDGATVALTPSLGPPPVEVPAVRGGTVQKATAALDAAGLAVGATRERYSDAVPVGRVIGTLPPAGETIPQLSEVTLVVSLGPPPVEVPRVVGLTEQRARTRLEAAGFEVTVATDFSKRVPRGEVLAQSARAGTELPKGSPVTITVSLGPEVFPAPDLVGMSLAEARDVAEEHGLAITAYQVPGTSGTTVISQLPPAGTALRYGSTITVYYG